MIDNEGRARAFVAARCTPGALDRLDAFVAALASENERQNLVSASSLAQVWTRHIADSAQLLDHAPAEQGEWLDLGSGAGLPGLIIAIMRPSWRVSLVESRKLRIEWLESQISSLELAHCAVLGRPLAAVESFRAGVISARAFAPLPRLIAAARRFSTSDTMWLLPKGRSAAQEVEQLPLRLRRMFHVEPSLTDADSGIVVGRIVEGTNR